MKFLFLSVLFSVCSSPILLNYCLFLMFSFLLLLSFYHYYSIYLVIFCFSICSSLWCCILITYFLLYCDIYLVFLGLAALPFVDFLARLDYNSFVSLSFLGKNCWILSSQNCSCGIFLFHDIKLLLSALCLFLQVPIVYNMSVKFKLSTDIHLVVSLSLISKTISIIRSSYMHLKVMSNT